MKMNEYLGALAKSLGTMDGQEKKDILQDYREHFKIGLASGKTEEEISDALGDPEQAAKLYGALKASHQARQTKGMGDAMRMIGAAWCCQAGGGVLIGVLYLLSVAVLAVLIVGAACVILGGLVSAGLAVLEIIKGFGGYAVLAFFLALTLVSGGLLWMAGDKAMWRATVGRLPLLAQRILQRGREV
ncbi:MAG: DUF1700 domain-containing protein [Oscillospiraceae bacterium]|nr:DUF1700 domain-containing protein [Oscillospiraceae bacterium]